MILAEVLERMKRAETLLRAGKYSAEHFHRLCLRDPAWIAGTSLRPRDIRDCAEDLEDTYLVRAFAVFETALRDYWEKGLRRPTHPMAEVLINSISSRCKTSGTVLADVHSVREYRNWLVHGGGTPARVTMAKGKSHLCRFLSRLPPCW